MKRELVAVSLFLIIFGTFVSFGNNKRANGPIIDPDPILYFNTAGLINGGHQLRHYLDSSLPTVSTNQSFNLSAVGFTKILHVNITAKDSTLTVSNMCFPCIYYYNLTNVYYNIVTSNTTVISLLGINVVGLQNPATVPAGTVIYCDVIGY